MTGSTIHLLDLLAKVRAGVQRGLVLASEDILKEARDHVPIEEATLERSGKTSHDPGNLVSAVSFDTPYAVVQHEDMTLQHDAGRTPKYLENAMNGRRATVAGIIAGQVRRELGG